MNKAEEKCNKGCRLKQKSHSAFCTKEVRNYNRNTQKNLQEAEIEIGDQDVVLEAVKKFFEKKQKK